MSSSSKNKYHKLQIERDYLYQKNIQKNKKIDSLLNNLEVLDANFRKAQQQLLFMNDSIKKKNTQIRKLEITVRDLTFQKQNIYENYKNSYNTFSISIYILFFLYLLIFLHNIFTTKYK